MIRSNPKTFALAVWTGVLTALLVLLAVYTVEEFGATTAIVPTRTPAPTFTPTPAIQFNTASLPPVPEPSLPPPTAPVVIMATDTPVPFIFVPLILSAPIRALPSPIPPLPVVDTPTLLQPVPLAAPVVPTQTPTLLPTPTAIPTLPPTPTDAFSAFIFDRFVGPDGKEMARPGMPVQVGNFVYTVRFAKDRGQFLKSTNLFEKDRTTTGKYIEVVMEVENVGSDSNAFQRVGGLRDNQRREFDEIPVGGLFVEPEYYCSWSEPLQPSFTKTCGVIFEVAADSHGFILHLVDQELFSDGEAYVLLGG